MDQTLERLGGLVPNHREVEVGDLAIRHQVLTFDEDVADVGAGGAEGHHVVGVGGVAGPQIGGLGGEHHQVGPFTDLETADLLVEPEGLEETVEGYQGIGTQMGGVSVQIDEITVNGDEAEIKYTLLFGGNPTYSDLTGSAVRTDAGWQISRDMFCGLMTSARVGCPDQ